MKKLVLMLLSASLFACSSEGQQSYPIDMDPFSAGRAEKILATIVLPAQNQSHAERVRDVSAAFLGTAYQASTLKGSPDQPEELVVNFKGVDCYTLLDYVEALSRSGSQSAFLNNLVRVRYVNGQVAFLNRKHFFTDWFARSPRNAEDITRTLSQSVITIQKQLNRRADGGLYIPGLAVVSRPVSYIPASMITQSVLDKLQTGDYVGVYSPLAGLDVSHTGIVIRQDGQVWYRNASSLSRNRKVVDTPLLEYMANKPGIVVLRVK